ncbi:MAG TPA: 23S rRNA (pseudouridine(1915)-N(3))-methyltransferase RlmH, partial [Burkholderiales bacterium]
MKLIVVAVGTRMPEWVNEAFEEYVKRMPRDLRIELVEVRPEPRSGGKSAAQLLEAEAARIERAVPRGS